MLRYLHALRYLWEVNSLLPMKGKQKRKVLSQVGASVRDYVTEKPAVDYNSVVARFGEPSRIAMSYVNEMESEDLVEALQVSKKLIWTATTVAMIILTLWVGVVVLSYAKHVEAVNGYYVDEVDTVFESIQEGEE